MILIDERLCLRALADPVDLRASLDIDRHRVLAMTWGFHYRLVRAISDPERTGRLTRAAGPDVLARAAAPPADRVLVLDPRSTTTLTAEMSNRHGLNLLAADLVATARHHDAEVVLSPGNVGRSWPEVFAAEHIHHRVH